MTRTTLQRLSQRWQQWRPLLRTHPACWPQCLRYSLYLMAFGLPLLSGWCISLAPAAEMHEAALAQEQQQKIRYRQKLQQLSQLPPLQLRQQQLQEQIQRLLRQTQDDGAYHLLLGEVAAHAATHHLLLEYAQPGDAANQASERQPDQQQSEVSALRLRLSGSYHDIGRFSAALAAASRPLWLTDLRLEAAGNGSDQLRLEAAVLTHHPSRPQPSGQP